MKIRTFRTVEGEKYADLVDWRSMPSTDDKTDRRKTSPKVNQQAENPKRFKRGGISYNEEESE
ncbi:MAG TPA: hypothetical protein VGK59_14905 [Ohtaekwangia sp.]